MEKFGTGKEKEFFSVPPDYFDRLPERITYRIEEREVMDEHPNLRNIKKGVPFKLPPKYFEELREKVFLRLQAENVSDRDLLEETPLLASIEKREVFEAPTDYFDRLVGQIKDQKSGSRLLPFRNASLRLLQPTYFLSIAAVIIVLLGLFWFLPGETSVEEWGNIQTEELFVMVENQDVDEYAMAELLGVEGLQEVGWSLLDMEMSQEEISKIVEELDLSDLDEADLLDMEEFESEVWLD